MSTVTRPFDPTHGAHARVDFIDRGKKYLAGQDYPLADLHPEKIARLHAARRIDFGPPTPARAKKLAERLEKLTKPAEGDKDAAKTSSSSSAPAPTTMPPPKAESPRVQASPRR